MPGSSAGPMGANSRTISSGFGLAAWFELDREDLRQQVFSYCRSGDALSTAGSQAEATHRNRYLVAERIYLEEVDPVRLVDVVINNTDFARPCTVRDSDIERPDLG